MHMKEFALFGAAGMLRVVCSCVLCWPLVAWSATVNRSAAGDKVAALPGLADRARMGAHRSARVDGICKLAEMVDQLVVNGKTKVADVLAGSKESRVAVTALLASASEQGRARYLSSGACEVTVRISTRRLIGVLKDMAGRHGAGAGIKPIAFERMMAGQGGQGGGYLTARGLAKASPGRERWESDMPFSPIKAGVGIAEASYMYDRPKAFWAKYCTGLGRAVAIGRARQDGLRRMARKLEKLHLSRAVTVGGMIAASDRPDTDPGEFLNAARCTGIRYHDDDLIVELRMEADLKAVRRAMKNWAMIHCQDARVLAERIGRLAPSRGAGSIIAIGMGVPPANSLRRAPAEVTSVVKLADSPPTWATGTIRAVGRCEPKWLTRPAQPPRTDQPPRPDQPPRTGSGDGTTPGMADHVAARLDAIRKLAASAGGLDLAANTKVIDLAGGDRRDARSLLTFFQTARPVPDSPSLAGDGTVQVELELDLKPLWNLVVQSVKAGRLTVR